MSTYKLTYFDARGVAEVARMLFAIGDQEYEDERFPMNFGTPGDFSTIIRPEYDAAVAEGRLIQSLNRVPLLTVDGEHQISESKAIERFIAKRVGLFGATDIEGAQIDAFMMHLVDINAAYQKVRALPADAKPAAMEEWFATTLPGWAAKFEKKIAPGGCAVGSKLSLADVALWNHFVNFYDDKEGVAKALAPCPNLSAVTKAVAEHPKVGERIKTRRASLF